MHRSAGVGPPRRPPEPDDLGAAALWWHRRRGEPRHAPPRHRLLAPAGPAAAVGPPHRQPADEPAAGVGRRVRAGACGQLRARHAGAARPCRLSRQRPGRRRGPWSAHAWAAAVQRRVAGARHLGGRRFRSAPWAAGAMPLAVVSWV